MTKRNFWIGWLALAWALALGTSLGLGGCASLPGGDPLRVSVVGIEPLEGQGLELRMAVKLRVQNPNDQPVAFDGVAIDLEVRGSDFASGVSPEHGIVPRFGEVVIVVPVTVSAMAMLKQAYGLATGDRTRLNYELRGKLAGSGFGGVRFASSGEFELPKSMASAP
jgi:LEA14-like dessication related protein